jgi:hypothetical protein
LCGLCQSNSFGYVFIGRVLSSKSSYNLFMIIFPFGDEEDVVLSYHDSLMASKVHKYEIRSCFFLCSIQEILLLMMSMGEGWSFMILEWWEGTVWSSAGYLQLVCQTSPLSSFVLWLSFVFVYCSISPNIREGLLEAFYGIYEKDPDKVIVLKGGGSWPCLGVLILVIQT